MEMEYSQHWIKKQKSKKKDITKDVIEFAIKNSEILRDKYWEDAFNAICKIPPSGRILKIVYKRVNQKVCQEPPVADRWHEKSEKVIQLFLKP